MAKKDPAAEALPGDGKDLIILLDLMTTFVENSTEIWKSNTPRTSSTRAIGKSCSRSFGSIR